MKKTIEKCYCDRCGKEMYENNSFGFNLGCTKYDIQRLTSSGWLSLDLCEECQKTFKEWWIERE